MKRRSMKRVNVKNENKPFKTLAVATIAGLSIIGVGQAQATTLDEVDLSQKPIDTPTLDYLHDNKVEIPQKTFQRDENGNIVKDANDKPIIQEGTPILAPQSGYSLTKLEANPDGSKPDGDNVITKFEVKEVTRYYDKTTGELVANPISGTEYKVVQEKDLVPVYYSVNLKQTEYGHKDATNREVKYYSWGKDSNSNEVLTEGTESSHDITYYVDKDRLSERITGNQNDANINKDFIGNTASSGGAISNTNSTIGDITGDFIGNYAKSENREAKGGAIYNDYNSTIGNITGDFIGNTSASDYSYGGAISNYGNSTIGDITGDFIGNTSSASDYSSGGAILNNGSTIGDITGDFIGNTASSEGGAIYNYGNSIIGDITGDFIGNYAKSETWEAYGGAIYNRGTIGDIAGDFIGNYAKSETGEAKGGAIYSSADLNFVADNRTNTFKDNYTESKGVKDDNAIYIDNNATLNFTMKNNGKIYMADNIDGTVTKDSDGNITDTYNVNIKGDNINNTTFYMLNDIRNANVTFDNTTINAINNQTHVYNFNSLTVNSDTNFVADVDLANAEMDRITATNYGTHNGNLNVVGMNLLSDATKDVTEIYFAEQGLKDNVVNGMPANGGYNLPSTAQTTFYTPIYKYNAIYDNRDDGGYFMFTKGDKIITANGGGGTTITPTGNPSDAYNPSVLAPSVASQAGANATMNQTFNYAFQNSDNFMSIPYLERISMKNANRYALSPTGEATDVGTFSPLFNPQNQTSSAWVKPYASFENIPLKNGPKVSNITYGTLVGFDTPIKSIRHGWDRTWTGYIGYNGASQRFSGVDATQNGGLVGGTLTLYKGNFFNATTVSSGAIVGDNRTMYGTDNYTMLMAGVGNKTGYNFEFKEGKIIIQPSMLLSYTFVNTFDYTNAAGVKIKNDPLHAIQIAPGVKFIANTKNGWQPYIGVNMIWNLLDKSKVSANDVRLPEMSIKPYVQYGVGVQKRFKDRYMAFGQAMIQNGGRNGISLTAGFRWAIGKEGKPLEKVQRVNNKTISSSSSVGTSTNSVGAKSTIAQAQPERKIIKQLSQTQRERIAKQYQNTTRTTSIGEMKKL